MTQCRPQDDTTTELGSQVHVYGVPHGGQLALQPVRHLLRPVMYMHVVRHVHDMCHMQACHVSGLCEPVIRMYYALHYNLALQHCIRAAEQC